MKVAQYILVLLFSMVKVLVAPAFAFALKLSFIETLLCAIVGGVMGFVCFYFVSQTLIGFIRGVMMKRGKMPNYRKAKRLVSLKRKYKLGIFLFILPFLSIPIMAFVVRKFFGRSHRIFWICVCIVGFWAFMATLFFSPICIGLRT